MFLLCFYIFYIRMFTWYSFILVYLLPSPSTMVNDPSTEFSVPPRGGIEGEREERENLLSYVYREVIPSHSCNFPYLPAHFKRGLFPIGSSARSSGANVVNHFFFAAVKEGMHNASPRGGRAAGGNAAGGGRRAASPNNPSLACTPVSFHHIC